ncbi:MAG: hypothetical protein ACK4N5_17670 [Myxococcales bacterium]
MTAPQQPKKSKEELRAQILASPETKQLASTLGMTLDAYVELVLDYAMNPEKKPVLNVVSDADAKAGGAATTEEVKQWFEEQMKGSPHTTTDAFEPARRKKP